MPRTASSFSPLLELPDELLGDILVASSLRTAGGGEEEDEGRGGSPRAVVRRRCMTGLPPLPPFLKARDLARLRATCKGLKALIERHVWPGLTDCGVAFGSAPSSPPSSSSTTLMMMRRLPRCCTAGGRGEGPPLLPDRLVALDVSHLTFLVELPPTAELPATLRHLIADFCPSLERRRGDGFWRTEEGEGDRRGRSCRWLALPAGLRTLSCQGSPGLFAALGPRLDRTAPGLVSLDCSLCSQYYWDLLEPTTATGRVGAGGDTPPVARRFPRLPPGLERLVCVGCRRATSIAQEGLPPGLRVLDCSACRDLTVVAESPPPARLELLDTSCCEDMRGLPPFGAFGSPDGEGCRWRR